MSVVEPWWARNPCSVASSSVSCSAVVDRERRDGAVAQLGELERISQEHPDQQPVGLLLTGQQRVCGGTPQLGHQLGLAQRLVQRRPASDAGTTAPLAGRRFELCRRPRRRACSPSASGTSPTTRPRPSSARSARGGSGSARCGPPAASRAHPCGPVCQLDPEPPGLRHECRRRRRRARRAATRPAGGAPRRRRRCGTPASARRPPLPPRRPRATGADRLEALAAQRRDDPRHLLADPDRPRSRRSRREWRHGRPRSRPPRGLDDRRQILRLTRTSGGHTTGAPSAGSAIATGRPRAAVQERATLCRSSPATAAETIVRGVVRGAAEAAPRTPCGASPAPRRLGA